MTTHGAYTQAKKHARFIKELSGKVDRNLKALFCTGEQLEEDTDLTHQLEAVNELLKKIAPVMTTTSERTAAAAGRYLKGKANRKGYVLQTASSTHVHEGANNKRIRPRTRGHSWD
jgi:hypothetical protein